MYGIKPSEEASESKLGGMKAGKVILELPSGLERPTAVISSAAAEFFNSAMFAKWSIGIVVVEH